MSNKRSKLWSSRRDQLDKKESKLREELDEASTRIENQLKKAAKATFITGGVLLAGYGLYQVFRKSEPSNEPVAIPARSEKKVEASNSHDQSLSFKKILLERLASTVMKIVGTQLVTLLSHKLGSKSNEKDEN